MRRLTHPLRSIECAAVGRYLPVLAGLWLAACAAGPASNQPLRPLRPDSLEHNGWDRDSDLLHVDVQLAIDLEGGKIAGRCTNRVRGLVGGSESLEFHARDLEIQGVRDSEGRELEWALEEELLTVTLIEALAFGAEQSIAIDYSAEPEAGLYFRRESKFVEGEALEAWSQGQPEDTRQWIPTWDFPNDRATYSGTFRVPAEYTALSNGVLLGTEDHEDGTRSYQWELEQRIPTYLIAVAVGQWEHYADEWKGIPIDYWVGPGAGEERARRAFGETPEMMSFFTELLGVEYPYAKYAQVAVSDFVAGGMENASLTIQNDYVIESPQGHIENDGETRLLVAHELAHQWFGDLVTCFGWSHLWLNEAWASYLELLFERHKSGDENFKLWMESYREIYLARGERTQRPLSEDWRTQVTDERCSHEYVKGPWVLYMLEREVGSEGFWAAVREYLTRHADDIVQTDDFARVIFDVTGRNVEGFLEQWVEGGGHPELEVRLRVEPGPESELLVVTVEQVQETSELVPVFNLSVEVELEDSAGKRRWRMPIDDLVEEVRIPLIGDLRDFIFDVSCDLLCELDLRKEPEMWARQATHESAALRWRSLGPLKRARRLGSQVAGQAMVRIAQTDPEPRMRRGAIRHLTRQGDVSLLLLLLEKETDPMARLEILELLARRELDSTIAESIASQFEGIESKRINRSLEALGIVVPPDSSSVETTEGSSAEDEQP